MTPSAFHHLALQVRDLPRAETFYAGTLGLPVLRRWPWSDAQQVQGFTGERSLWLGLAGHVQTEPERGGFLALEAVDGAPPERSFKDEHPGLHLVALCIGLAERSAWEEVLEEAGVPVVHRTDFTLYVRDPEGNRVGLSHWPHSAR